MSKKPDYIVPTDIASTGIGLFNAIGSNFDYGSNYSMEQSTTAGQQKGSKIGGGVGLAAGLALAPLTGGSSAKILPAVGGIVGGMIGKNKAKKRAEIVLGNRKARQQAFRSMYEENALLQQRDTQQRSVKNSIYG